MGVKQDKFWIAAFSKRWTSTVAICNQYYNFSTIVDFQPYEFITPLDLHTLNLAQAVHKHNLIAQYKDTQSLLSKLENKRKQLNQLNPNLPQISLFSGIKGKINFPAEGYRARVYLPKQQLQTENGSLQQAIGGSTKENVYLHSPSRSSIRLHSSQSNSLNGQTLG